jgi:hypothetical protein
MLFRSALLKYFDAAQALLNLVLALFHCRNLDTSQTKCSRDPAPPWSGRLRPGSASAQVCSPWHPGSAKTHHENRQFLTRARMAPARGPKSATTVQFTTSASQNSSPDSCPRLPVHAGMLFTFSLWLRILKLSVSLLPSHLPSPLGITYILSLRSLRCCHLAPWHSDFPETVEYFTTPNYAQILACRLKY